MINDIGNLYAKKMPKCEESIFKVLENFWSS